LKSKEKIMLGSWFFAFVPMLFGLAAAIFIITLLYRLVVAVKKDS